MNVPCITSFKTPFDIPADHEHCRGQFNVHVAGVDWVVDFDYAEPCIYVGTVDVTECIKSSLADDIIRSAIRQRDEELP